jgi:phospholipase/carboxylesterase
MKLKSIERAPRAPGLSRTMVLLHGYGADEHDLLPLAHELDPRLRAVSLRAPISLGGAMRAWFNLSQDARGLSFDPAEVRAGMEAARAAVEEIAAESPKPFLLGFSQGAGMALGAALTRPGLVAGVLSLSGVMRALDPADLPRPSSLKGFPVFAAHGEQDPVVPIELGRSVRDELVRLGVAVSWHEYPMGHMVVAQELEDARAWLQKLL